MSHKYTDCRTKITAVSSIKYHITVLILEFTNIKSITFCMHKNIILIQLTCFVLILVDTFDLKKIFFLLFFITNFYDDAKIEKEKKCSIFD